MALLLPGSTRPYVLITKPLVPFLAMYLRLHLQNLFAVRRLHPGNSTCLIMCQSIPVHPHHKHTHQMCLWWRCRDSNPGLAHRSTCFNVTILFITRLVKHVKFFFCFFFGKFLFNRFKPTVSNICFRTWT